MCNQGFTQISHSRSTVKVCNRCYIRRCRQYGHDLCVTSIISPPATFPMPCNLACWTLLYLSANKKWKEKAIVEVQNLMAAHTNTISSEPIHQRLSMIPISAWEER